MSGFNKVEEIIKNKQVDLVISCVDNYAARVTLNKICNKYS